MSITVYHNARCSKSRQTLALLAENGIEPTIIDYLENPPSLSTLLTLQKRLSLSSPRDMMRTKDALYNELNLDKASDEELIHALLNHPVLLERPIVVVGDKAVIGRPPENILAIIS